MFCTVEGNRVAALPTFLSKATQGPKLTETDVINTRLPKSSWASSPFQPVRGKNNTKESVVWS